MATASATRGAKVLPSVPELLRLRKTLTDEQIGRIYGTSGNAVYKKIYRAGATSRERRQSLIWKMEKPHRMAMPARNLRVKDRIAAGLPVTEAEERRVTNWLKALQDEGLVVGYDSALPPDDPQTPQEDWRSYGGRGGWFLARRHPDDDPDNVITTRDMHGRFRTLAELHPDNEGTGDARGL